MGRYGAHYSSNYDRVGAGAGGINAAQALANYIALLKQQGKLEPRIPKAKVKKTVITDITAPISAVLETPLTGKVRGWNILPTTGKLVTAETITKIKSKIGIQTESVISGRVRVEDGVSDANSWSMIMNSTERDRNVEKLEKLFKLYLMYKKINSS